MSEQDPLPPAPYPAVEPTDYIVPPTSEADARQRARMVDVAGVGSVKAWDPRLAYELALEMAPAGDTFMKHGYNEAAAAQLLRVPAFVGAVKKYRDEIVAGGVSFKLKAKVMAEDLLEHSYDIATDPETPPSVRADLIKWTAAVADLGPKDKKGEGSAAGGSEFRLNITFAGAGPARVTETIDVTPTSKETS